MAGEQNMIERVARAMTLISKENPDELYTGLVGRPMPWWKVYVPEAVAAIKAMREPTRPMVDKAWEMMTSNLRHEEVYRHLIDAALAPGATLPQRDDMKGPGDVG